MNGTPSEFLTALAAGYQKAGAGVENGLLLAVSGGADSMALLHGTLTLWPEQVNQIAVAHVNHGLRGRASHEDAAFVAETALKLGIRLESLTVDEGSLESDRAGSLEAAARSVRYKFLAETATRLKLPAVVTAHHFDDQAETVLHNIIRGSGLRGLAGMQPSRPLSEGITLIRPMLEVRSTEVHGYLDSQGAGHQTDGSNKDVRFTRNRIRTELLPHLRSDFNLAVDDHIVSLGRQAEEAVHMLDGFAEQVLRDVMLEQTADVCRIDRTKLGKWNEDVRRYCLALLWIQQDWPRKKMTSRHYKLLANTVGTGSTPRGNLPGAISFELTEQLLRLTRRISNAST